MEDKKEKKTPRHEKMYKDSPKLERGKEGKMEITKAEKKSSEVASGTEGVAKEHDQAVMKLHQKHAKERMDMHHKHEKEHLALMQKGMNQEMQPQEQGEPAPAAEAPAGGQ